MSIFHVIILAIVQGLAELLPVSSSAHVVVAEKLLGLNPSTPQMTLLLVMLHTGTMFAVIVYFWNQWKRTFFSSSDAFNRFAIRAIWASLLTALIGYPIIKVIEKTAFKGLPKAEIELLFGRLDLIAPALFAAGLIILLAGLMEKRRMGAHEQRLRRQRHHAAGRLDGCDSGALPSVPRLLPLRRDHLHRHADRRQQRAR